MSNIIDQYVVHLESLDISPAKRSSATEVNLHIISLGFVVKGQNISNQVMILHFSRYHIEMLHLQVVKGLGEYFNVSLGPQLLYSIEKLQYRV